MPAKSQAQRAYIYATKGKKWAARHGFNNKGKLPARVNRKKAKPRKRKAAKKRVRKRRTRY